MFVWTLIATYWVGGWKGEGQVDPFLIVGGIALDFVHPIFLVIPILLYDATRRRFGRLAALIALVLAQFQAQLGLPALFAAPSASLSPESAAVYRLAASMI